VRFLKSPLFRTLVFVSFVAIAAVLWIWIRNQKVEQAPAFRLVLTSFAALPGWGANDPRAALEAFRRSCAEIVKRPAAEAMGWAGYAGTVSSWLPACNALPAQAVSTADARAFFATWFTPVAVDHPAHFTGYYEPLLSASRTRSARYRIPIYGRPSDLITADLGAFRHAFEGEHISGRIEGLKFVPYETRADIDTHGLPTAPVLLYTDDPVSLFFLQIQGSGLAKLADGKMARLAYAARNGRPYTPVGRVLIDEGALASANVSLQSIRAWLDAHPGDARRVMEADQSFIFFALAPLGDPALGSPGTEGIPVTPEASLAVDPRFHAFGTPIYVATTVPDPDGSKPDRDFRKLLIAQDTGGAIKGPARGDIFFGAGKVAEAIAGRLNAHGQIFVLVPKAAAAALGRAKDFPDAPS
jgi:membrane-bound lytic murein transglycosylase A